MQIAKRHRVSEHTVRAIRARETQAIAERKQRLMSIFANVAEISAERMEELAGKASLRDAGTTAGIATDKLLLLSGDPTLCIQHSIQLGQPVNLIKRFQELSDQIAARLKENRDSAAKLPAAQLAWPGREAISDTSAETGLESGGKGPQKPVN